MAVSILLPPPKPNQEIALLLPRDGNTIVDNLRSGVLGHALKPGEVDTRGGQRFLCPVDMSGSDDTRVRDQQDSCPAIFAHELPQVAR